jgi:uncharacterized protein YaiL (DUF2058 family)
VSDLKQKKIARAKGKIRPADGLRSYAPVLVDMPLFANDADERRRSVGPVKTSGNRQFATEAKLDFEKQDAAQRADAEDRSQLASEKQIVEKQMNNPAASNGVSNGKFLTPQGAGN